MGRKNKKKYPTLFVLNGSVMRYEGTLLALHNLITDTEWHQMVEETIKYKSYIKCLKDVAFPILDEKWTDEDEEYKLYIDVAVSRMRNIDPLYVMKWNEEEIVTSYTRSIKLNAYDVRRIIDELHRQRHDFNSASATNP
jgi:hypothetical protein